MGAGELSEEYHDNSMTDDVEPVLVFRAGSLKLGIPAHYVDALHAPPQHTPVPLAPNYVVGLAIFRGEVVPLVDIGQFFEQASHDAGERSASFERVAVISTPEMQVGILCSEVRGIVPVDITEQQDGRVTRGRRLEKVVAAEVSTNDGILVVLDVPKLLDEARVKL